MLRVAGSVTVEPPELAVTAPLPEQLVEALVGLATISPEGNVSVSAAVRFAAVMFGFVSVIVIVEATFAATETGEKDFASVGVTVLTVRIALAGLALLPFEVCSAPAPMVFV
jgi:hypothetical protein